jgi:hypothetical protein
MVIALVVTPEGLPLAYEVLPGNTKDSQTLRQYLAKIERQYGKAPRAQVMDRGIPTEAVLAEMRQSEPPVHDLVGTPKGSPDPVGTAAPRPGPQGAGDAPAAAELAVAAPQRTRCDEDHARATADEAGSRPAQTPRCLVDIKLDQASAGFTFALNQSQRRKLRRREGGYLLRTNLTESDPATLWQYYIQLVAVEEAFKNLKADLIGYTSHCDAACTPWRPCTPRAVL